MDGKVVAIGAIVIFGIIAAAVFFYENPEEWNRLINPPPDVKFYQTSLSSNEIKVGTVERLSVNAINNEFDPVNVTLELKVDDENADSHLEYPKTTDLGTLEFNGSTFESNKIIQIRAKQITGKFTPFEMEATLIVNGQVAHKQNYPITIVP